MYNPVSNIIETVSVDDDTYIAEMHFPCPLKGTGDIDLCYRMVEFDRIMVGKIGGQFTVLRSQAEAGINSCRIAIRPVGVDISDLRPAYDPAELIGGCQK